MSEFPLLSLESSQGSQQSLGGNSAYPKVDIHWLVC